MAPVTLPPSFYNSFWSTDYRTGLDVLFKQLDKVRLVVETGYNEADLTI
jgi:soluble cytochrome b562